ncbi:MAG: MlaD family protein [Candidatus Brocadiia bacterium]|jgi:phospholipid/cholesterol/gamma-HCH transport system substrate-binding protein|nr:MlaD family protein [Candidatus Brocadiia bacterium]
MGRKILVGMLLLGALMIFALATFYIEDLERFVRPGGYTLLATFESAQGLVQGDEVQIAGVPVGRVQSLEVNATSTTTLPVKATLWIREGVEIREGASAAIEVKSIFGGAFLTIIPGDRTAPALEPGGVIVNTVVRPGIAQLMAKAEESMGDAQDALADFRAAATSIKKLTDGLGDSTIGRFASDDGAAYEELQGMMASVNDAFEGVKAVTDDITDGQGLLNKLLKDPEMAADADEALQSAREAFAEIQDLARQAREGDGVLAKLLNDPELSENVETMVASAKDAFGRIDELTTQLQDGEGLFAKLLTDPQFATDFEKIATDVKAFTGKLAEASENFETSALGRLMSDSEAYDKLIPLLDNLNIAVLALTEGEGTLHMLMNDPKLYNQLTTAADSVQKLLDDYREQSPVLTFASAIFGAF